MGCCLLLRLASLYMFVKEKKFLLLLLRCLFAYRNVFFFFFFSSIVESFDGSGMLQFGENGCDRNGREWVTSITILDAKSGWNYYLDINSVWAVLPHCRNCEV